MMILADLRLLNLICSFMISLFMSLITVVLAFAVRAFGSCGPQVCLTFRVIEFHEDTPAPDKHSQTNHAHARNDKK